MMKRLLFILCLAVLAVGCVSNVDTSVSNEKQTIRLPMGFIADPQYAPYYVAVDKGYYAEEGLEIDFDYSFETDGMALVGASELPFAIVSGEQVLLARAQNIPVVYVLEWFQKYPIAVVSKTSAGIYKPEDLQGHTVGLPGFFGASYVGYVGLLSVNGIPQTNVNATEIGFTQVETLLSGEVDAVVGYANNEPIQLRQHGEEVNVILVSDHIDLVANGIVTNETVMKENPELVHRFVRATLKGLRDVLADPDMAYAVSKKFVDGLDDSRKPVLEASLPMWEADILGETTSTSWIQTQNVLISMGLLDAPLDNLEAAYTNEFIEANQP